MYRFIYRFIYRFVKTYGADNERFDTQSSFPDFLAFLGPFHSFRVCFPLFRINCYNVGHFPYNALVKQLAKKRNKNPIITTYRTVSSELDESQIGRQAAAGATGPSSSSSSFSSSSPSGRYEYQAAGPFAALNSSQVQTKVDCPFRAGASRRIMNRKTWTALAVYSTVVGRRTATSMKQTRAK